MVKVKEPKIFTLEEAKATLPFVKRIVEDVLRTNRELNNLKHEIRMTKNLEDRRLKIYCQDQLKQQLKDYHQELDLVGCRLKNPGKGIVGFYWNPADNEIVELCWKYGEDDISYWQQIGNNQMRSLTNFPLGSA